MSEVQYPFIDVAVHERVSEAFAAGMAVALFSPDMQAVAWANGRGAALFGFDSIYDFLDQGPDRADLMFRQVEPMVRALKSAGDRRAFTIRVSSGFSRLAVQASCELIRFQGKSCVLLTVPVDNNGLSLDQRAERMLEGLDDPETHMAVLDADGSVLATSGQFQSLAIPLQTTRMLVSMADNDRHRLVKRPVSTASGYLPAAVGKVSGNPSLYLLFVIGFAAPRDLGRQAPEDQSALSRPVQPAPEFEEAISAIAAIEDTADTDDDTDFGGTSFVGDEQNGPVPEAIDTPVLLEAAESEQSIADDASADDETSAIEAAPEPNDVSLEGDVTDLPAGDTADAGEGGTPAPEPRSLPRDTKTIRFVWKIDAGGRFSEISSEFADAVGPHAADISGMAFSDLAALFNLDPDGKIGELLSKRDTWSGRTIWWPVEGTSLVVPVDLAALPTYTRTREFDGFRGFGIVRMADAAEDPHASGLSLGISDDPAAAAANPVDPASPHRPQDEAAAAFPNDQQAGAEDDTAGSSPLTEAPESEPAGEALDRKGPSELPRSEPGAVAGDTTLPAPDKAADMPSPSVWPAGERPALKLVENAGQRHSDKVVRLEERRSRLSAGEQAAFQEIARQLDTIAKEADGDEMPDASGTGTSAADLGGPVAIAPEQDPHALLSQDRESPEPKEAEEQPQGMEARDVSAQAIEQAPAAEAASGELDDEDDEEVDGATQAPGFGLVSRERLGLSPDIVDQMPVALLIHAGDDLIHANGEFLKLSGYDSLSSLSQVGGLDALLQRQELEDKTSEAGGMVVVRADDTLVPVTARLQSVRWNDNTALMLALMPVGTPQSEQVPEGSGAASPGTPSRSADQLARLQVEVEELRAILETATDGVVIIGADGEVRSINRAASALFNFDADDINGKPFVTLFAHESQRAILDYLNGLSGHGVASVLNDGREVIGREASGGFIPLFMTIGRLTSSNGYCAVIRDITQWKRTEDDLRTAKRAAETANAHKSEFLAHVSHEIRTPLNAIIGFADMMATERLGPVGHPRYVEYANDIGRSGRHVLDIVNDLLDISKIEAGELDLDFIAVGLNETVSEAVSLVQPQANSQRVIIRTALSQSVPQVVADLRSIKQIVLNILSNAIRFTPSGGQIVVSTAYETNGSVVLRIRDTGIGMSRAELETAMKPFRQVAGTARTRGDGTGLGLPLTKAMVDANRASFAISSAPNEGTLVEITFPSPRVLAS